MTNLRKEEYFVLKNMLAFLLKIVQARLWVTKKCEQLEVAKSHWVAGRAPTRTLFRRVQSKGAFLVSQEPLKEGEDRAPTHKCSVSVSGLTGA